MKLEYDRSLSGMRVLVCGKGGSGKSSILSLMAQVLVEKGYKVLALDGDASNPGGLTRLLSGLEQGPKPLIDFFGGRTCVTCPVDDPSPLTRKGDTVALPENKIASDEMGHQMIKALDERMIGILGLVHHDPEVAQAGLAGTRLGPCGATKEILDLVGRFEAAIVQSRTTSGNAP